HLHGESLGSLPSARERPLFHRGWRGHGRGRRLPAGGRRLLTFAPGETTRTITVLVHGDRLFEGTEPWYKEDFFVHLSDPTNAYFASPSQATAYGHIVDDEPFVVIGGGFAGKEGNAGTTPFTFTVTLSAASDVPVTVDYGTFDHVYATAGIDYTAASGTL